MTGESGRYGECILIAMLIAGSDSMVQPIGTVSFLFTDIQGSSSLWENHPAEMRAALARHDALMRETIGNNEGYVFKTTRSHPAFALTGAYVGHDELESSIAGVFSRAFARQGRVFGTLHLGVKWGRASDGNGGASDFGGFVGAQIPLSQEWNLVGETSSRLKFDRASASSVGFMYQTRKGLGISLGMVNSGRSSRMNPFFGVGIPLGI